MNLIKNIYLKKISISILFIFCFLLVIVTPIHALESPSQKTNKIPIFVLDKEGNPIYDLKREDLELIINNNPIDIIKINGYISQKGETPILAIAKKPSRLNFIIIDAMFNTNYGLSRARKIACQLVDNGLEDEEYVILKNTMSNGISVVLGPTINKKKIKKSIKKLVLIPGITLIKDMFSSHSSYSPTGWSKGSTEKGKSYMDRFYADSDRTVDELTSTDQISSKSFKGSFKIIAKKLTANLFYLKSSFRTISRPKIVYLFSEGYQEKSLENLQYIKEKIAGPNITGILFDYFRNLLNTIKNGGVLINAINPGKLKTSSYNSSGAMNLQFMSKESGQYFEGENTKQLIKRILNKTSAYYELTVPEVTFPDKKQRITIHIKREGIKIISPYIKEKETPYSQMKPELKRLFVLNIITQGTWSKGVSSIKKTNYKIVSREKTDKGFIYEIEVNVPESMQNQTGDIFIIGLNPKTKRWVSKTKQKALSSTEKMKVSLDNKGVIKLYFVIIHRQTAHVIYNQIK